jgi:hypothetical protein
MTCLCKKILNIEIIINQQNKPTKKDFEMTYFQLLLDLMEKDEFMYAWINSELFHQNLETLFEMHVPSQTDWDCYLSPGFHEYLPGSANHATNYIKNYNKAQTCLKYT